MVMLIVTFSSEFEDDPDRHVLKPLKYIGIEVWQVNCFALIIMLLNVSSNDSTASVECCIALQCNYYTGKGWFSL